VRDLQIDVYAVSEAEEQCEPADCDHRIRPEERHRCRSRSPACLHYGRRACALLLRVDLREPCERPRGLCLRGRLIDRE
jgi:hypothetical protein